MVRVCVKALRAEGPKAGNVQWKNRLRVQRWVFRVQGFRGSGVQGFRGSGVQGFRGSGVQGFRVQGFRFRVQGSRGPGVQGFFFL